MVAAIAAAPSRADQVSFDSPIVLSNTKTAGAWSIDRKAPAGFSSQEIAPDGTTNTLKQSISAGDYESDPARAFYNTQGRAYGLAPETYAAQIDVYVDSNWSTSGTADAPVRLAGFWGVGLDASSAVSDYPILEVVGAAGDFAVRTWDSNGTGSWSDLTLVSSNTWHTLGYSLAGGQFTYTLDGTVIGTVASDPGTVGIGSVILQGYNNGLSYDIHWNNLETAAVPEPASLATIVVSLGLGGLYAARRKRRTAEAQA